MDIEQARTFIAVMELRSFVHAAARLHVTQSTVSARIRTLEQGLGCCLFDRSKAGVALTAAGTQFSRHAAAIVRLWSQARQEVALPEAYTARLNIGAQISHWDDVIVNWMCWLRETHPDLAVRSEIGSGEALLRQMVDGLLDFAILYSPPLSPGLRTEKLFDETIVLASTTRQRRTANDRAGNGRTANDRADWERHYVFVDWGAEFRSEHAMAWPDLAVPALHFSVGTVALDFILRAGGAGYFPLRMVRRHLRERRLFRVGGAPSFRRAVYLTRATGEPAPHLEPVLDGLRRIALASQGEEARTSSPAAD